MENKFANVFENNIDDGIDEQDFFLQEFGSETENIAQQQSISSRLGFIIRYNLNDIRRRKVLFCCAFLAVFVSIFCTLIINVFVKKGSLIFVKMSEDLQIDAVIMPSMRKSSDIEEASTEPNNFRFNFTRI